MDELSIFRLNLLRAGYLLLAVGLGTFMWPQLIAQGPSLKVTLQGELADLMAPDLDEATFIAKAAAWREKHLNKGALARIAIVRKGAAGGGEYELVTFPNGETRRMSKRVV